jgi:ABC-type multidrug transport system fused ATPase/permease subunit
MTSTARNHVIRTSLVLVTLAGLTILLFGGSRQSADPSLSMALVYFVGMPVVATSILLLGIKAKPVARSQTRRERRTILSVTVLASALFFPGLFTGQSWLMLAAAAVPMLGAIFYFTVFNQRPAPV